MGNRVEVFMGTNVRPTSLSLSAGELTIEWSDGRKRVYGVAGLRNACSCATCATERERSGPMRWDPAASVDDLGIREMAPVGNYAYKIMFSDGHDTGIFTLDLLRYLGREA